MHICRSSTSLAAMFALEVVGKYVSTRKWNEGPFNGVICKVIPFNWFICGKGVVMSPPGRELYGRRCRLLISSRGFLLINIKMASRYQWPFTGRNACGGRV
jgi:hypothetical protein